MGSASLFRGRGLAARPGLGSWLAAWSRPREPPRRVRLGHPGPAAAPIGPSPSSSTPRVPRSSDRGFGRGSSRDAGHGGAGEPLSPAAIALVPPVLGSSSSRSVAIAGFTVLAQRRMRSIGMLESTGATDRHVRLVISANGTVVGVAAPSSASVSGSSSGWPIAPVSSIAPHHLIGVLALPWPVVIAAMVLAVVAAYFGASRLARAITKIPIVHALSGDRRRLARFHRSAFPGIVPLVLAFLLLGSSGGTMRQCGSCGAPELLFGLVLLIPGRSCWPPLPDRDGTAWSLRAHRRPAGPADLARYRARRARPLAAISLGVLVAVIVLLAAAARYGNVLDYAGPNLSSKEIALHTQLPPPGLAVVHRNAKGQLVPVTNPPAETATPAQLAKRAPSRLPRLDAQLIALESPNAGLNGTQSGQHWSGQIYVATPKLLKAYGIPQSKSIRGGSSELVSGTLRRLRLVFNYHGGMRSKRCEDKRGDLFGRVRMRVSRRFKRSARLAERYLGSEYAHHRIRHAQVSHQCGYQ